MSMRKGTILLGPQDGEYQVRHPSFPCPQFAACDGCGAVWDALWWLAPGRWFGMAARRVHNDHTTARVCITGFH